MGRSWTRLNGTTIRLIGACGRGNRKIFHRWREELVPITAPKDRDGNRSNYMTWGLLQLPGNDRELCVYATEAWLLMSIQSVERAGRPQPRVRGHG